MPNEAEQDALDRIKEYLDSGHSLDAIRQAGWATWIDHLERQGYDLRTGERALAPPGTFTPPSGGPAPANAESQSRSPSPAPTPSSSPAPSPLPSPAPAANQTPPAAAAPAAATPAAAASAAPANVQPTASAGRSAASLPLIESDIRRRVDTDKQMSFGTYILWIIGLSIFTLGIGLAVYVFVIQYQLIERRNQHFARQRSFYTNVLRVLREKADATGRQDALQMVSRAEAELNDAIVREGGEHNPWIWGVILPILTLGIASFYTYWFLTVDYRRHSVRQRQLTDTVSEALRQVTGNPTTVVDESVVPDRNYWIYLLLTLVTFGLFGIYWQYVLFNDPNVHFARQAIAEDQLVSYLRVAA